jgi:hypothetical protein
MNIFKFNKNRKMYGLIFLFFGMMLVNYSSPLFNLLVIDNSHKNNEEINNDNPLDFQNQTPETSEYQNFNGAGENFNITLHQSLLNISTIEFTNLDTSNSFTEPFPNFNGYNTSLVNITIDGIFAPNHTLIIEDDAFEDSSDVASTYVSSFTVPSTSYLINASFDLVITSGIPSANIYLFNSSWTGTRSEPVTTSSQVIGSFSSPPNGWNDIVLTKTLLNNSITANNTWFIGLRETTGLATLKWRYVFDSTNGDNSEAYYLSGGWQQISNDYNCKLDLTPINNIPKPSDINLKINNTIVIDITDDSGYYSSNEAYSSPSDILNFTVSADWWDVSCNITSVQINYTKTDVQAISSYDISGSGQIVQWNVTITNGLNYFDSRITDFNVINFTIPRIWHESSIKVFNGSTEKTIFKRLINNDYREIQVLNAGNGTYWYVNATSSNLFSSIDTFVSGIARDMVNHSNTVAFNITFSERIFDGLLNLSVFSPSPRYLNHTKMLNLTPLASDDEFHVTDWDVSVNVTEYGVFKIQMSWNNDTAAGFLEDYITVIADTDLILSLPKNTFDSGDTFNMTVFYNDIGQDLGIQADTINYQIGSGGLRTDNIFYIGNGYYNITFSCNDADFTNYGLNSITVNTYKDYFNNQTRNTSITILAETDANIVYPPDNAVFDSTDSIVLQIFYNNTVKDVGITGATINYSLDGGNNYIQENISPEGPGEYNITISASDSWFGGYGFKNIIVNCSKDYYYNQSKTVTIQILGITSITPQKIPDQPYYNSAETFNISIYYEDTAKSIGISGATIDVDVDGTVYNPPTKFDYGDGNYDVTIDCSDSIFSSYKTFSIRVNVTLENYYNQSTLLDTLIVGNVSLFAIAPSYNAIFIQDQTFNITIQYNDTILGVGIDAATIDYSLDDGSTYKQDNVNYIGEGKYNITIDVNDADFISYGYVNININASKQYYENTTTIYTFHRQIRTQISSSESTDLGTVIKGLNVTYTFDYEEFYTPITLIREAGWTQLSSPVGFTSHLQDYGNGTYTMHLDTTNVLVTGVPYVFEFNIFAVGNETQVIQLTVDVLIIRTEVVNVSYISEIARNSGLNQSLRFYFNDTTNNDAVRDLTTSNIIVKNYWTGTQFSTGEFWLTNPSNNGTYFLDITMGTRNSGWYTLEINASRFPNYDYSLFNITFYYRGNYTDINLISLSDPSPGVLSPIGLYNFTIFEGSDLDIEFNITDSEYFDNLIIGDADSYTVRYTNLGTGSNGILVENLNFITLLHTGTIFTSNPALTKGRYSLNITTSRTNYEDANFIFNLTIIEKYQVRVNLTYIREVDAGDPFTIMVKAEFLNGTVWFPLVNCSLRLTPYLNDNPSTIQTLPTNSTGEVLFVINVLGSTITMNLTIQLLEDYYHVGDIFPISDIEVTPLPPSFRIEDILPYLIIAVIALVTVVGSVAIYRGVVIPKKKEKLRILTEVKTIFDDAINLEHILVLYKGTGTCIFFKSYGSEQIDPELIGGFLSAVSSFGKEMATQSALNEISYGDKMLLLADGYLIRVALVLGKKASLILRRHLKEFIKAFEKTYADVLPNWRGQLNYFRNAGLIVDDLLNTSIILPHQISYDFSSVKDLKNPHSKDVLKVAQSCCEEAEREFFFIATLLKDASERTNKDTAEIFMGIKELRDKKILIPIEISAIEAQPISQQELNLINQKVGNLSNLTSEEKQKLVQDLGQLGPIEREAYLSSLAKQQEIVTAPIKTTVEGIDVDNRKAAKRGIKELTKRGKVAKGKKDYINAVEIFESAAILASNWELSDDYVKIEETIRTTKIEDLKEKKTKLEKESKIAVKAKKYAEAAIKYKYASKMASEIFKLGDTTMTKEVKRLTNKANEYEKLK